MIFNRKKDPSSTPETTSTTARPDDRGGSGAHPGPTGHERAEGNVPPADDDRKVDSITDLEKPSWKVTLKRTVREFLDDKCTDLAAALTYFAVLSLFPALLAMVSVLGLFGQGQQTTDALLQVLEDLGAGAAVEPVGNVLNQVQGSQAAGFGLVIGVLGALWTASNYVNAFSRAMNSIYEIGEGRPMWKLRPLMMLITVVLLIMVALVGLALVFTGPLAESVGNVIGLGSTAVTVWSIAKWPVLAIMVMLIIAILYWATPNVQQPKFRWVSPGAAIAFVVWVIASAAFGFYIANFGNYNATYGTLGGVIIFLLWLWITNNVLLFGAEVDAELERGRQLQSGMAAEEEIQLPARDTRQLEKKADQEQEIVQQSRKIRLGARDRDRR